MGTRSGRSVDCEGSSGFLCVCVGVVGLGFVEYVE